METTRYSSAITQYSLGLFKGGTESGGYGATISFSGKPLASADSPSLLSALLSETMPKSKMVRLTGELPISDNNFLVFVEALKKYGFVTTAIVKPELVGSWLSMVPWVILQSKDNLLMIQPNELWYSPRGTSSLEWKDIIMPVVNGRATYMYLDITDGKSINDVINFFCKSQYTWQVLD